MGRLGTAIVVGLVALVGFRTEAQAQKMTLAEMMRAPGHISIMRHAIAPFENAPRDGSRRTPEELRDCAAQRNLDDKGRDQARLLAKLFADEKITFEHVFTSIWCRCRETADLAMGRRVENLPLVNSYYGGDDKDTRGPRQLSDLRAYITKNFKSTDRALLMTHGSLIFDLSGWWVDETEVIIVKNDGYGGLVVLGRGVPELEFPTSPKRPN